MKRCSWCNTNNPLYVCYHDNEWGVLNLDEKYLFQMLILEGFQAGLSWECVLNKRESFLKAYKGFIPSVVASFDEQKIVSLMKNKDIICNKRKILASVSNAKLFLEIEKEYSSFSRNLLSFTGKKILLERGKSSNELSDTISSDLRRRGMKFTGTKIIYSYLQAIGLIHSHEETCYLANRKNKEFPPIDEAFFL
mgnify:CR=1 FL=1